MRPVSLKVAVKEIELRKENRNSIKNDQIGVTETGRKKQAIEI